MNLKIPRGSTYHKITEEIKDLYFSIFSDLNNQKIINQFEEKFANYNGSKYSVTFPFARTAFHFAAIYGHAEVVKLLLEKGATADAVDSRGWTPLHYASYCDSEDQNCAAVVDAIVAQKPSIDVNALDNAGLTPLHLASKRGKADAVKRLLNHGANVLARDQSEYTPLHWACQTGHEKVVAEILEFATDLGKVETLLAAQVSTQHTAKTALHFAARSSPVCTFSCCHFWLGVRRRRFGKGNRILPTSSDKGNPLLAKLIWSAMLRMASSDFLVALATKRW